MASAARTPRTSTSMDVDEVMDAAHEGSWRPRTGETVRSQRGISESRDDADADADIEDADTDTADHGHVVHAHVTSRRDASESRNMSVDERVPVADVSEDEMDADSSSDAESMETADGDEPDEFDAPEDLLFDANIAQGTAITARDVALGRDIQGIPWERLTLTRTSYRQTRMQDYSAYENPSFAADQLAAIRLNVSETGQFYDFVCNNPGRRCAVVHFQLRNLMRATSKNDVYYMDASKVFHWSPPTRKAHTVLNLEGGVGTDSVDRVPITTLGASDEFVAAGGFNGEVFCRSLSTNRVVHSGRVTTEDNGITNAIEISTGRSGQRLLFSSNNDCRVRAFALPTFVRVSTFEYDWPVNYMALSPDASLMCVVGDDPLGLVCDARTGERVATLSGHRDFSFACAWSPDGTRIVTGNQDRTARVYDVRKMSSAVCVLGTKMGAVRSLRFTSDGRFLALAEPADFVHVFDASADFATAQVIDFFSEIAGFSFTPDSDWLYVGLADGTYGSLMEFGRKRGSFSQVRYGRDKARFSSLVRPLVELETPV